MNEFVADLEPVCSILRVFARGTVPGVDEYVASCTACYSNDGKTVELKGITSDGTSFTRFRTAILRQFYINGVNTVLWERRKSDGSKRQVRVDLDTYFGRSIQT